MIAAIILIVVASLARLAAGWISMNGALGIANFYPLIAIALCGAALFPRPWKWLLPLGAFIISDLLLTAFHPWNWAFLSRYIAIAAMIALGWQLQSRPTLGRLLLGTWAGALLFYFLTNTTSWMLSPSYPQTLAGWWQALTTGIPGYPPTYLFLRNSLLGNTLFTTLLALCYHPRALRWQGKIAHRLGIPSFSLQSQR